MSIKMPLKFAGSYKVTTRHEGSEKQEICQKLSMTPLGESEQGSDAVENFPPYRITYFYFGCRRVLEGKLKENHEDRTVFDVDGREMEFCPTR
jgi:hypothetical protein